MTQNQKLKKQGVEIMLPDGENWLEKKESQALEEPTYTIAEGNLQRHHFASLGTTSKERKKLVSTVEEQRTDETGVTQVSRWKVIGGGELGLPTWLDKKVLVAVIDVARRMSFPVVNPIPINIKDVCRQVGFNPESGRNRGLIRQSLERISGTTIEAAGAFYFKKQQANINDRFSVFQRVVFAQAQLDDGTKASRTMVWISDKILSNINNWYIVPVDTKFFMKLVPIAGRLYELLSNKFFGLFMKLNQTRKSREGCYTTETYESICQRMPISIMAHRSRAMQQFAKAHKQLLNAGFLAKVEWLENGEIIYYPGPKAFYDFDHAQREVTRQMDLPFNPRELDQPREKLVLQIESRKNAGNGSVTLELLPDDINHQEGDQGPADGPIPSCIADLEARGVSRTQAQALAADFSGKSTTWKGRGYPTIEFYCQYYDWMMKQETTKWPESGAWLSEAIKAGWKPPNAFKTREQIEEANAKQAAQEERRKEAERRRQEEEEKRFYLEWLSKTPAERWEAQRFSFQFEFKREHGQKPTPAQEAEAKRRYLAKPETPEQYQERNYGAVKYPLTV